EGGGGEIPSPTKRFALGPPSPAVRERVLAPCRLGVGVNRAEALTVRSILVYVTSDVDNALGENVLKLPLLLALDQAFPMARIAWVPGTSGAFYLQGQLAPLVGGRIGEFITDLAIPTDPRAAPFASHPIL